LKKIKNIQDVCEVIWKLEEKYDLLDFEIDGVKPWQFRRIRIYYDIAKKTKVLQEQTNYTKRISLRKKALSYIKNSIKKNPFFFTNTDTFILTHPNKRLIAGQYIDIYTYYFIKELLNKGENPYVLEEPIFGLHFDNKNTPDYLHYSDFIDLVGSASKHFYKVNLSQKQEKTIQLLNKDLEQILGVPYNIQDLLIEATKLFKTKYFLYAALLKKIKPKQLYVVVSYLHGDLIKAAKDLGITTYEFQHGTFSEYHLGYSFPDRDQPLDYFPDKFLVWNEYWKNLIKLPINDKEIIISKFKHLEEYKNKNRKIIKRKMQAVVISQAAIGNIIAERIYTNWDYFKNFKIVYKLHPGEYDRWNKNVYLKKLVEEKDIKIVKDINLYSLLMESEFQIGVFSTALYEGLEFSCKTILLDLPGIEYMNSFIQQEEVEVV